MSWKLETRLSDSIYEYEVADQNVSIKRANVNSTGHYATQLLAVSQSVFRKQERIKRVNSMKG